MDFAALKKKVKKPLKGLKIMPYYGCMMLRPREVAIDDSEEPTSLLGWVWLRGMVFNPREDGSRINARAINLHYLEFTPQGIRRGVVRLKSVSFRNGMFIKMSEKGLLGNMVHVTGFCHGSIDIQ